MLADYDFEAYMASDRQTLLIRRRLDIDPCTPVPGPPHGRYVRLGDGQTRAESLVLSLPVESRFFWRFPTSPGEASAKRLVLEIGYYPGDMPRIIRDMLGTPQKSSGGRRFLYGPHDGPPHVIEVPPIEKWFVSLLYSDWCNWPNKHIRHRGEEIIVPWTGSTRLGERGLRVALEGLEIPYKERYEKPTVSPPDLKQCTRLEIHYRPSVLGYYFPYQRERTFMSPDEIQYLQSLRAVTVDDREGIAALAQELRGGLAGGLLSESRSAQVVGYHDCERLTSFVMYDDRAIVTEDEQCIRYSVGLPSTGRLTSVIQPFKLRLECANNLMNLSYRLRFLYDRKRSYPASKWCRALVNDHRISEIPLDYRKRYLTCPAADPAECHYAMNPNCRPDSPGEMVLLFETKAGWNQHGGAELFAFDNHDPKGGCVLLNDGTVKFIRTEEELHALRWR